MQVADLPALNATLNAIAAAWLVSGYVLIRQGRRRAHRAAMIAAFVTSALFLISYLVYHSQAGSRPFTGQGWIRPVYFTILISHVVLAAAVPPLAIVTLARGLHARYDAHRRIARRTLPIWLYVSLTGVVVYLMLVLKPAGGLRPAACSAVTLDPRPHSTRRRGDAERHDSPSAFSPGHSSSRTIPRERRRISSSGEAPLWPCSCARRTKLGVTPWSRIRTSRSGAMPL